MLPSNTSSPMRTTTEPKIASSTVTRRSTGLPTIRVRTSARRDRRRPSSSTALRTSATTVPRRLAASPASSRAEAARSWPSPSSTSRSARVAVRSLARPSSRAASSAPARSAAVKAAMAASSPTRSGKRRGGTRWVLAMLASSSTLASSRRPPPRSSSSARLGSGGRPGSASALRSRAWVTSRRAKATRSASTCSIARLPRPPAPPGLVPAAWSNSAWAWPARAGLASVTVAVLAPAGQRTGLGLVAELADVLVDEAELALPVQRVADHPGGQLDGERADLAAELADGLVALGADRLPGPLQLPLGVGVGLGQQVLADPLGVGARLLQDPMGLVLGGGEPLAVLLQQLLGLVALLLGLLELALDVGPPVLVHLGDLWEHRPVHEEQQDQEGDRAPDQLVGGRQDGVAFLLRRAAA